MWSIIGDWVLSRRRGDGGFVIPGVLALVGIVALAISVVPVLNLVNTGNFDLRQLAYVAPAESCTEGWKAGCGLLGCAGNAQRYCEGSNWSSCHTIDGECGYISYKQPQASGCPFGTRLTAAECGSLGASGRTSPHPTNPSLTCYECNVQTVGGEAAAPSTPRPKAKCEYGGKQYSSGDGFRSSSGDKGCPGGQCRQLRCSDGAIEEGKCYACPGKAAAQEAVASREKRSYSCYSGSDCRANSSETPCNGQDTFWTLNECRAVATPELSEVFCFLPSYPSAAPCSERKELTGAKCQAENNEFTSRVDCIAKLDEQTRAIPEAQCTKATGRANNCSCIASFQCQSGYCATFGSSDGVCQIAPTPTPQPTPSAEPSPTSTPKPTPTVTPLFKTNDESCIDHDECLSGYCAPSAFSAAGGFCQRKYCESGERRCSGPSLLVCTDPAKPMTEVDFCQYGCYPDPDNGELLSCKEDQASFVPPVATCWRGVGQNCLQFRGAICLEPGSYPYEEGIAENEDQAGYQRCQEDRLIDQAKVEAAKQCFVIRGGACQSASGPDCEPKSYASVGECHLAQNPVWSGGNECYCTSESGLNVLCERQSLCCSDPDFAARSGACISQIATGEPVGPEAARAAEAKMATCQAVSTGLISDCQGEEASTLCQVDSETEFWCTELIIRSAQAVGIDLEESCTVRNMQDDFIAHEAFSPLSGADPGFLEPGMVVFMTVIPGVAGQTGHVGMISEEGVSCYHEAATNEEICFLPVVQANAVGDKIVFTSINGEVQCASSCSAEEANCSDPKAGPLLCPAGVGSLSAYQESTMGI